MNTLADASYQGTQIARRRLSRRVKRAIDVLAGTLLLIAAGPVMAVVAMVIWMCDGRPILYEWRVVGLQGRPLRSWKFRTMARDADARKRELLRRNEMHGPVFKMREDPRVTPIGCFLRKYSLDELPQLWSVVLGDMSLVGPRAPLVSEFQLFSDWQKRKLSVVPGLTCLWQVRGRSEITNFDDWVRMDLEYIDHWSLMLDFKILFQTVPVVFRGKGAY